MRWKAPATALLVVHAAGWPQQPAPEEHTIRITVNLVQLDAVVTDSKGKHVTDLTRDDFEVLQDGKPQAITSFSHVSTEEPGTAEPKPAVRAPAPSRTPLKPEQVRRTIALLIDDLGLSWESMAQIKPAAKKFIDEQLQPGDLAAVVRTGAGMGSLQGFTTDKRLLEAALQRVNWNPLGRGGVSAFPSLAEEAEEELDRVEDFRREMFSIGTLGAVNYIVRGLRELPGRKSVVLFSDNVHIFDRNRDPSRMLDEMRRLTDLANRSSVVIYAIDPRGLPTLSVTAAERTSGMSARQIIEQPSRRRENYFESQDGMNYLAEETGGKFLYNTNDIGAALAEVLEDQKGYYLLGYSPSGETFNKEFHRIRVRVKRQGLRVRSRNGFIGIPDKDSKPVYRNKDEQLFAALASPFTSGDIQLRLTALFANNVKQGSFVRSLLHIAGRDLKYTREEQGWQRAALDVMQITYGENGEAIDRSNTTYNIRVKGETYRTALRNGYIYTLNHPIRKAGAYQLRTAVRDAGTSRVGSATQFIEVPNVAKGAMALSGLAVFAPQAQRETDSHIAGNSNTAVRIFHPGQEVQYGFQIYNVKLDAASGQPNLESRVRVYRGSRSVVETRPAPIHLSTQKDVKRISVGSVLKLNPAIEPGEYLLEVEVVDKLRNPKNNKVSQWADFRIERKPQ